MKRFDGKSVVITGGSSGIGRAIAYLFAAEGARVLIAGRDVGRGEQVAADLRSGGGDVTFARTDVTVDAEVAGLAARASESGPIDYWFSNAGSEGPVGPLDTWTEEALTEVLAVNLKGVLSSIHHASSRLRRGGAIINTSSFVGTALAVPIAIPYAAAKAGVVAAGNSAASALEDAGIRVFTVCPWVIDTPMVDRLTGGAPEDKVAFAAGFAPSGRLTDPADVAAVFADLADSSMTARSGDAYLVDAGPQVSLIE